MAALANLALLSASAPRKGLHQVKPNDIKKKKKKRNPKREGREFMKQRENKHRVWLYINRMNG